MKYLVLVASLIATFSFATLATAARPCKVIAEACLAAGVIQKGESKQVMMEKCIKPVVAGQNVAGVNVESATINACKAKIATR
jgi:hypothetical protein